LIFIFLLQSNTITSQIKQSSSAEVYQALKKLNVLGSVLYIAAHPDDENNVVLTYLSKEKLVRTGYLSLTRGDGGQNLLGNEKGDLLGVIRTQELLSARKIDGAEQFFTRAIDFGFSKSSEETLKNWNKELLLGDIVKVIRQFKPDIVITRFTKTLGGHGHHLVSAILAEEAFYAAADPKRFPEQLKDLETWQAKRIIWDAFVPSSKAIPVDVGIYNRILGKSYNELSSDSRSMHKSQGFGAAPARGSQIVQFDHIAGDTAKNDIFENINLTWKRISGGDKIEQLINQVTNDFDYDNPEKSIPNLIEIYNLLDKIENKYWSKIKKKETAELIRMCSGLWIESVVWQPGVSPGSNVDVRSMVVNRSNIPVTLESIKFTYSDKDTVINKLLEENKSLPIKYNLHIPETAYYTQPYWLKESNDGKHFIIKDVRQIGLAENGAAITANFVFKIGSAKIQYDAPVLYRWTDAVEGEKFRSFVIRPPLSINVEQPVYVFNGNKSQEIKVHITAKEKNQSGVLKVNAPKGWNVEPEFLSFNLADEGTNTIAVFKITAAENSENGDINFYVESAGKKFNHQMIEVEFPHIKMQTIFFSSKSKLVKLNIKTEPRRVAYVMGSGDDIPLILKQLDYDVDLLSDSDIDNKDLAVYDVIITGIRAFNTRESLGRQQKKLIEFSENGGTWIVQHNTRFGIQVPQIGPYPFPTAGNDRVAEENAKVEILIPEHDIFNYPNNITEQDFNGWVQERGVNFADTWGGKLYPLLSCSDTGEPAKLGGLLYARYGKGIFIYTAYSWFRQIPEGVPGAIKIFVNILSSKLR